MSEKSERIPVANIDNHPELTPPHDEKLADLLKMAMNGKIPVYYAAVPFRLIRPFSPDYDPRRHPIGLQAIRDVQERWNRQQFTNMVVYQQNETFVMSDDYIVYYACMEGSPDYVPCWVLGHCKSSEALDLQGPIRKEDLPQILLGTGARQ